MGSLIEGNEKLRIVAIFAGVRHCNQAPPPKLDPLMKLVLKGCSVYRLPTRASASRIAALDHKPWDHPVKNGPIIVPFHSQLDKITACQWNLLSPELNFKLATICGDDNFGGC